MHNFYSKPIFEKWIKKAGPKVQGWFNDEVGYLIKQIKPGSKILDIGCGFGRHLKVLAPTALEITGIDNSRYMVARAKQNLSKYKNVKVLLQDVKKLNFKANSFDYVICMTNTFGNFNNSKIKILNEIKRVCKKGGKIIISVYSSDAIRYRMQD